MARATNLQVLTNQLKARYPGIVIYGIGDAAHKLSPSSHNEDDTSGSKPDQQDADNNPEHRGIDAMLGGSFSRGEAYSVVSKLVNRPRNRDRLTYVIFDGGIWSANNSPAWSWRQFLTDPHRDHPHINGRASNDEDGSLWDLDDAQVAAPAAQQEEEMLFFASNPDGNGPRWAVMTGGFWVEYDAQAEGTWTAVQDGNSYSDVGNLGYRGLRQPFQRADRVLDGTGPLA